jgi:hypothetical protein
MQASNTVLAFVWRVTFAAMFIVAMGSTLAGQASSPEHSVTAKQVHWHKYVNRTYGFSLRYPDTYTPIPHPDAQGRCPDYDNYKCLLWLARRDNRDVEIGVSLDLQPFHLTPNSGDVLPTRQLIGGHIFYGGTLGSMAVGFSDNYYLNLKGKTLVITFGPGDSANPGEETKQLEPKMLNTLRTF